MGDGTKENPFTGEDVLRLIEGNGGTAEGLDLSKQTFVEAIDLSDLDLSGIKLSNVQLFRANFNGSNLDRAIMQEAYLGYATFNPVKSKIASLQSIDLRGAHLHNAEFREADLTAAQFQGESRPPDLAAFLDNTDFRGANLFLANFKGCYFYGTKLERASIRGADVFDAHLEEVDWGSYKIGEEIKKDFYSAESIYHRLKLWYTTAGFYDIAGEFFFREMTARRKNFWWQGSQSKSFRELLHPFEPKGLSRAIFPRKPFHWAWSKLLSVLWGYGERPIRVVISVFVVVLVLAAAYYLWGSFSSSSFWDTLYYSAVSFTALGYGWAPQPTGWAKGVGAAEAFVGVFMMALFLITFIRKITR